MQITDTLALGGLERVAVNVANCLPRDQFRSFLCTTRAEGPLSDLISPHVTKICLGRSGRFEIIRAARRLAQHLRQNQIQILHAHGTSLFISVMASLMAPGTQVLWHDHFGRSATEERSRRLYRLAAMHLKGVIAVNEVLADWSRQRLKIPRDRIWYIPNFVCEPQSQPDTVDLPGTRGSRIVCVANLRPEKDHQTLLKAMKLVARNIPEAHLILIGCANDPKLQAMLQKTISSDNINATWLGQRNDVAAILKNCDLGVLSSVSEGLPLALIEYGMAGLAVVATEVGKCSEVLDQGRVGLLVPPSDPIALAPAIVSLLKSPEQRAILGKAFQRRVHEHYSEKAIINRICEIYMTLLIDSPHVP